MMTATHRLTQPNLSTRQKSWKSEDFTDFNPNLKSFSIKTPKTIILNIQWR